MSTATAVSAASKFSGLRPINLRRDLRQIASLMQLCFGHNFDANTRHAVREMELIARSGPLTWMLGTLPTSWQLGFVWIHSGKIVGNVSAQPTEQDKHTWLIANVAVHPDHRRQGIATALTQAALSLATKRGAKRTLLQVHHDNASAQTLYAHLGFSPRTTRTSWVRHSGILPLPIPVAGVEFFPARRDDWRAAYHFVRTYRPEGFDWQRPLHHVNWQPSLWRSITNLLFAEKIERWIATDLRDRQVLGIAQLQTTIGQYDQLNVVTHPAWRERLEPSLIVWALRRLRHHRWHIKMDHPAGHSEEALTELGFKPTQTLIWMQKDL